MSSSGAGEPVVPEHVFTEAIRRFWGQRDSSAAEQALRGASDQGDRSQVTAAKHMAGFEDTISTLLVRVGVAPSDIHRGKYDPHLPGFFRASKAWDIVITSGEKFLAAIELKSIASSFGNNLNNRSEEALGNAVDLWTAFREGAFGNSPPPWLGYVFALADVPKAAKPVRTFEPQFKVLPEFRTASYARRAELLCRKLVLERHYSSACFLMTDPQRASLTPNYTETAEDLGAGQFLRELLRHVRPI